MEKQLVVTEEGLKKLEDELDILKTVKRQEIAEKIKVARGFGDLSENSEYDEAKNEQAMVEAKIAQLEKQLKNVKVLDESEIATDVVSVGLIVKVHCQEDDETETYSIVGSTEADPFAGKISDESPVGKALIGRGVGETAEVELPNGNTMHYQILEIGK
ncbi:transcription elongation factor GreA [Neobittarella massiliensis]|uniref:Transcription elongation factor GreA n=2 Tax=Oscillospiraceae TaxID=216572 RepID=A0A8J6IN65_9FIRM|nr:transcription elongation factor GreA [Neobittarella massiliensis]MBC3514971.1 transcription elongation factor GreA [Neobittarella massiliensis]SCJ68224.1 Transcript cleavage factor greA [uncultured Anaerotruncus sp.]